MSSCCRGAGRGSCRSRLRSRGAGVENPLCDRVITELACPTVTYTKALYGAVQKACISWLGYMVLLEDVTLLQRRNAALSIVKEKLWRSLL